MAPPIGLLPAAGRGLRFGSSGYAKELFPLLFTDGERIQPRPICELSLESIRAAGADQCVIVLSPDKTELLRVLTGAAGIQLAYVVQAEPRGLPEAVRCAQPWLADRDVLLALPDTIVFPADALARVHRCQRETAADLVLGVFPVEEPERLGPIVFDGDGVITRVLDKPGTRDVMNSWGIASWTPRFTRFCADWDRQRADAGGERVLGHVFAAAISAGMTARAVWFDSGSFLDIGTPSGLRNALQQLASDASVVPSQASPLLRRP